MNRTWYLPAEAADLLGVSTRQLQRWADAGLLPHTTTLGGVRRYAPHDIDAFTPPPLRRGRQRLALHLATPNGAITLHTSALSQHDATALAPLIADAQWALDFALEVIATEREHAQRAGAA